MFSYRNLFQYPSTIMSFFTDNNNTNHNTINPAIVSSLQHSQASVDPITLMDEEFELLLPNYEREMHYNIYCLSDTMLLTVLLYLSLNEMNQLRQTNKWFKQMIDRYYPDPHYDVALHQEKMISNHVQHAQAMASQVSRINKIKSWLDKELKIQHGQIEKAISFKAIAKTILIKGIINCTSLPVSYSWLLFWVLTKLMHYRRHQNAKAELYVELKHQLKFLAAIDEMEPAAVVEFVYKGEQSEAFQLLQKWLLDNQEVMQEGLKHWVKQDDTIDAQINRLEQLLYTANPLKDTLYQHNSTLGYFFSPLLPAPKTAKVLQHTYKGLLAKQQRHENSWRLPAPVSELGSNTEVNCSDNLRLSSR